MNLTHLLLIVNMMNNEAPCESLESYIPMPLATKTVFRVITFWFMVLSNFRHGIGPINPFICGFKARNCGMS